MDVDGTATQAIHVGTIIHTTGPSGRLTLIGGRQAFTVGHGFDSEAGPHCPPRPQTPPLRRRLPRTQSRRRKPATTRRLTEEQLKVGSCQGRSRPSKGVVPGAASKFLQAS
jgi:hypothetical protein